MLAVALIVAAPPGGAVQVVIQAPRPPAPDVGDPARRMADEVRRLADDLVTDLGGTQAGQDAAADARELAQGLDDFRRTRGSGPRRFRPGRATRPSTPAGRTCDPPSAVPARVLRSSTVTSIASTPSTPRSPGRWA